MDELEKTVDKYQELIAKEIARRKADIKLMEELLAQRKEKLRHKKRQRQRLQKVPHIEKLARLYKAKAKFVVGNKDFTELVKKGLSWFYRDMDWELSDKQVWRLNDLATNFEKRQREREQARSQERHNTEKWNEILDAIRGSDNSWCRKMDTFFKQNGYLSQRQVDVVNRILGTTLQVPSED